MRNKLLIWGIIALVLLFILVATCILITFEEDKNIMDTGLIATIASVGGALIGSVIGLIFTVIKGDKKLSKINFAEHVKQENDHMKLLERQEGYTKTIDNTSEKVVNIDKSIAIMLERDNNKNSLISKDVSNSLMGVMNSFAEQTEEIRELRERNKIFSNEIRNLQEKNEDLAKMNKKLEDRIRNLDRGPTLGR